MTECVYMCMKFCSNQPLYMQLSLHSVKITFMFTVFVFPSKYFVELELQCAIIF